jgi:peptidyl-prolyl cis-trans isomerase D
VSIGAFQKDGKFDRQQYEAVLKEKGKSPLELDADIRKAVISQQLTDAYTQNGFAAVSVAENLLRLNEQQREVEIASLDSAALLKQLKLSDSAIADYYDKNAQEFQVPERANIEYVVLSADSLASQVAVGEVELNKYFEEHQAEFGTQEQRQAAHILISVAKNASDAERQAAKAKAEQVLQQLKQTPSKFAALAKQYSQDPGSAANGGDLGLFGRGAMVKPFEDSVFSLKVGEISDLILSDFGYHIIKLTSVKAAKTQPLSEVKGLISQRLKLQLAAEKFAELAEKFSEAAYTQSDTLKPAAELAKVSIQRGVWLSKGQPAAGLWTDKVLQAVFSEDALKSKRNTAAIEVAPNTLLAARVVEFKPASTRPLTEVSVSIRQKLEKIQVAELIVQQGNKMLEQLKRGEKVNVNWKVVPSISRGQHAGIAPELVQEIFRADTSKLPAYVGWAGQSGYVFARIDAVKESASLDEGKRARIAQQIRQVTGEELLSAYMHDVKKKADITLKAFEAEEKK